MAVDEYMVVVAVVVAGRSLWAQVKMVKDNQDGHGSFDFLLVGICISDQVENNPTLVSHAGLGRT